MLTFCNSSLYLRRGLSSSISVLDVDSLRDIGEVILPSSAMQSALFSDGFSFYTASISSLSTLAVRIQPNRKQRFQLCTLNDSFVPSPDNKNRRKFRLTDVSFHSYGSTHPIPHELPLHLPPYLHSRDLFLLIQGYPQIKQPISIWAKMWLFFSQKLEKFFMPVMGANLVSR